MNKTEIAGMIDHTILKPVATASDVKKLCEEAKAYGFASVCINPYYVPVAKKLLDGTQVKVCTVIGFPLGANSAKVKAFEAEQAVLEGALEVDMVVNIGALKSKDYETVKEDVIAVVQAAKKANASAIVKVIIETCLLTDQEKEKVCQILLETGAEFVKTSTGFSTGGATVADLKLMKKVVGDKMQIKASGGVKNLDDFKACVEAGANRVGASSGVEIVAACQS